MNLLLKIVLLFLIVFNFRLPAVYNSVFLAVIVSTLYYLFKRRAIPFTYFTMKYNAVILFSTLAIALISLFITVFWGQSYLLFVKRFLIQFLMLFALVYALPILVDNKKETAYEGAIYLLCCVFALQGLIHLTGFLIPSVGESIFSMKGKEFEEFMSNPEYNLDRFRGYALTGSVFFELPSAYGAVCILFFRMLLIKGQQYITGIKRGIMFSLFLIGIILSGRTGFVGVCIGLVYYLSFALITRFDVVALLKSMGRIVLLLGICIVAFHTVLSEKQKRAFVDDVFPFAFEAYYNYLEKGRFSTNSTDDAQALHYYPLRAETILKGHGVSSDELRFYKHTDSGYMKSLIYGGIFFLLIQFIYQSLYFISPLSKARTYQTREAQMDFWCFLILFGYILLLHYKESALGYQHITEVIFLFIGSTYLLKYYSKKDKQSIIT